MDQRFIEYDLPLAEISEQSAGEKNIHVGLPPQLHVWWARRPLSSSRATTLAALLNDPGPHQSKERKHIKELISLVSHRKVPKGENPEAIEEARELIKQDNGGDAPKVFDTFAGGGSIPLEALRLGCETHASDYNPVAAFVEKATLEWPQRFGIQVEIPEDEVDKGLGMGGKKVNLFAYLVEKWSDKTLEQVREEVGQFYPTESGDGLVGERNVDPNQKGWTPVGFTWARTVPCQNPVCGATIPLVKQFWLCKKDGKRVAYRPVLKDNSDDINFEILHGSDLSEAIENGFDPSEGTVSRGNASCPVCGQVTDSKKTKELGKEGKIGKRMISVVLHHPDEVGKKYRLAEERDEKIFSEAKKELELKLKEWDHLGNPIPNEKLVEDPRNLWCRGYGLTRFSDLFNSRQKLALVAFLDRIKSNRDKISKECEEIVEGLDEDIDHEELAKAVNGSLAILLDRLVSYMNTLVRWVKRTEIAAQVYSRQALPMLWDYVELNPFSGSTGSLNAQLKYFLAYIDGKASTTPENKVRVTQQSATSVTYPDNHFDAVVTDPPYYDNVPYAALSDFFYVWLKRAVGEQFPDLFSTPTTPKTEEAIMEPTRHGSPEEAKTFFENMLGRSFEEMHRVLKPQGTAVVVYAHKTTEGWETMLRGLIEAGFLITGSWPIHTERKSRLRSAQSAALASSIYMVCRKGEREEIGFWNDIQPQIKDRVEEKLEQFWKADVIRGGDFFISAIGPGMEAYSRYDRVETYSGDEVTVRDLLQYIRRVATDFLVHRLLRDVSSGSVDKEGQFYLTYRWTFRDNKVEYDDALRIAKAEGVNLERLADRDTFVKKGRKYITVRGPQDRDEIEEVHNMVDAMHLACQMWEEGRGKDQIGKMLAKHGYSQSPSFWQFCQAISECLPDGNKEKQWLEGMLMSKDQYQQAEAVGEGSDSEGQITIDFDEEDAA